MLDLAIPFACLAAVVSGVIALRCLGGLAGGIAAVVALSAVLFVAHLGTQHPPPPPPTPLPPGWAEAGRALSAYGARHREVHGLLRSRAVEEVSRTRPH